MKHFKRAAAMLLAVVLSLCLAVTAFAADDTTKYDKGNLTVTGSGLYVPGANGATGEGKEVTAILMFTANASKKNDAAADANNEFDSYTLNEYWAAFFKDASRFEAVKKAGNYTGSGEISRDALSDASVAYVESLRDNDTAMAKLAHDAQKWVRAHSSTFEGLVKKQKAQQVSDDADKTKGTATFTELTAGYYLVFPEGGSTGDGNRGTDAILVNVPKNGDKTEVTIKSKFPTVDKQVSNNKTDYKDNTTAQVGDTVTFKLTAKVPDMTDYTTYKFIFHDTLSNGLAYDAGTVKVTIGGTEVTKEGNYTVNEPTGESKELTVTFADLTKVTDATAGRDIVVTYTAKITKDAVTTKPATNKAYLEYSNNPGTDELGKSNPDESKVYTYDINIFKFYTNESNTETALANATFKLTASEDSTSTAIELVKEEGTDLVYHVKGNNEADAVSTVTTGADGKITIKGLKAGTYYLHETIAPTGYNKLKKPIKIDITVTSEAYTTPSYKVDDKANADNTIKVENVKGVMLPETGSIGTIGLTALGVAVVLLGVFAPRKKKKENQ